SRFQPPIRPCRVRARSQRASGGCPEDRDRREELLLRRARVRNPDSRLSSFFRCRPLTRRSRSFWPSSCLLSGTPPSPVVSRGRRRPECLFDSRGSIRGFYLYLCLFKSFLGGYHDPQVLNPAIGYVVVVRNYHKRNHGDRKKDAHQSPNF